MLGHRPVQLLRPQKFHFNQDLADAARRFAKLGILGLRLQRLLQLLRGDDFLRDKAIPKARHELFNARRRRGRGAPGFLQTLADQKIGVQDQVDVAFRAVRDAWRNGCAAIGAFQRYGIGGRNHLRVHSLIALDNISDDSFRQARRGKNRNPTIRTLTRPVSGV